MSAARSYVLALDQTYIVVERYDRLPPTAGSSFVQRVHQEDMCQALGLMPGKKYQEDGGPGIAQLTALIRRTSSEPEADVERFLQANIFNWLIGGTDAHAKNYSLLIGAAEEVRLAPLYDLSSQLPYGDLIAQRVAMKIGEHYDIARVAMEDWRKVARQCFVEEDGVVAMITGMIEALPDEVSAAADEAVAKGLSPKIVGQLARRLIEHTRERAASLRGTAMRVRKRTRNPR
jgi:serine/threonine-protein kinase HipA